VPAWVSGGSSKVIRERLAILSVGDIRQALMTMAHEKAARGDVVKYLQRPAFGQSWP
jgi:hypothetical protein